MWLRAFSWVDPCGHSMATVERYYMWTDMWPKDYDSTNNNVNDSRLWWRSVTQLQSMITCVDVSSSLFQFMALLLWVWQWWWGGCRHLLSAWQCVMLMESDGESCSLLHNSYRALQALLWTHLFLFLSATSIIVAVAEVPAAIHCWSYFLSLDMSFDALVAPSVVVAVAAVWLHLLPCSSSVMMIIINFMMMMMMIMMSIVIMVIIGGGSGVVMVTLVIITTPSSL